MLATAALFVKLDSAKNLPVSIKMVHNGNLERYFELKSVYNVENMPFFP